MCKLCKQEKLTEWYYEDDKFWYSRDIQDKGYKIRLLGVYKKHGNLSLSEAMWALAHIKNKLISIANSKNLLKLKPNKNFLFDEESTIKDHLHVQLCIKR